MSDHSRRSFLQQAAAGASGLGLGASSAGAASAQAGSQRGEVFPRPTKDAISLAMYSLNRSFSAGLWDLFDIARIAREDFDVDGLEYVTIYFKDVREQSMLRHLNQRAADYGLRNVLIMVDQEGDMGARDRKARMQAAVNHRKWVDIAAYLGCFAIRCNCTGTGNTVQEDPDALERSAESFNALLEYAKASKIVVCIENHGGGLASNADWLAALAKKIDNPNFGLLPDFGNFAAPEPATTYQRIRTMMPHAVDISVKGSWAPDGTHPRFSLDEALRICKQEFRYTGFWGIESSMRRPASAPATPPPALPPLQVQREEWTAVRWTATAIRKVVLGKA
ncbi:MAG: sugar phosphate isomerase/epimerase [Acidobacteria bacterium]|nr:sugar phosphate isomerase/epimerase [Acidobacteriota bacterium]